MEDKTIVVPVTRDDLDGAEGSCHTCGRSLGARYASLSEHHEHVDLKRGTVRVHGSTHLVHEGACMEGFDPTKAHGWAWNLPTE
jgi:hypothetical protein